MRTDKTHLRLQYMLKKLNLTQKDFAIRTGLTESAVCRYIQGTRVPNAASLVMIADAIGVSPTWLLGYGADDNMEMIKEDKNGKSK